MRNKTHGRLPRALASALVLAMLAALLLAGTALAAGKPGKPTAKAPKGTTTTVKPTFKWSKATRAAKYELRVYKGKQLLLKKTGLKKTSWRSTKALPKNVSLAWKVRASNARGSGAWGKRLAFRVVPPGPAPTPTPAPTLKIGDAYGGGIVAYILQPGDPGYVAGQTHGLIAATADQTPVDPNKGIQWAREPYWGTDVPDAKGTAIGAGAANTTAIIAQNGAGTDYAAGLARAYNGGGYSDWFLPSKDELHQLYLNRVAIGGFWGGPAGCPLYWSSSVWSENALYAWWHHLAIEAQGHVRFGYLYKVRAVRAF